MKKISLIFLGIILAFSCKKEKANMPDDCACVDPNAGKLRTLTFAKEGEQFTSPSFNPKNPNEFVF